MIVPADATGVWLRSYDYEASFRVAAAEAAQVKKFRDIVEKRSGAGLRSSNPWVSIGCRNLPTRSPRRSDLICAS
jgi:hypothetical protein